MSNPNFPCPQSSHSNLYSFPVLAPTDDSKMGKPPDFENPPVHQGCPWTWLEYLGLVMIGSVVTGSFLFCFYCKRKIGWASAN